MNGKITLYGVFKDVMKCFIAACGITLLFIFFGNQSLFLKNGELLKQAVQAVVLCIFIILLLGTEIYRLLEIKLNKSEYKGDSVYQVYPVGTAVKCKAKLEETGKDNDTKE